MFQSYLPGILTALPILNDSYLTTEIDVTQGSACYVKNDPLNELLSSYSEVNQKKYKVTGMG